ncbi:MAG: glutamine-hydrolyzing GMP synthase [Oscillospiraceae bacterium]|nr:glutamine-hydrolyzing GMP synthase [Oscillospiraceae bacterium]
MLENTIKESVGMIREKAGENGKVIVLVSGGVDSMVTAALLLKALPADNIYAIYVDHGFMRKNESDFVYSHLKKLGFKNENLLKIDAGDKFIEAVAGIIDPEEKRRIIGGLFIEVVREAADGFNLDYDGTFIAQGTLKPDLLESANPDLGKDESERIKTHHNDVDIVRKARAKGLIIETNYNWYKDDVRKVARILGIDEAVASRQPFPGPGLAVRIMGEVTREKLALIREADAIVREELDALEKENKPDQYFAVLTDSLSVGINNGIRKYSPVIAVRAVATDDYMTCGYAMLPHEVLNRISSRITSEVEGVSRVVYDITNKPPATIEWE